MEYRNFVVESRALQWGQWTEWKNVGTFYSKNDADAKRQARRQANNDGWTRQDGALQFRARLAK
jgi:hypothetical protein